MLNKYYPPDFDPAKLPRGNRKEGNEMKVRMMLPMSVRCKMCGNFMYKGTKFNTRKEDVLGEDYLGIQVGRQGRWVGGDGPVCGRLVVCGLWGFGCLGGVGAWGGGGWGLGGRPKGGGAGDRRGGKGTSH